MEYLFSDFKSLNCVIEVPPLNFYQVYSIQAHLDILLHSHLIPCWRKHPISVFGSPPGLLNKIELTVEFWVEKCNVTMRLHKLNDCWLLSSKVRLIEQEPTTAACCLWIHTFEGPALGWQIAFFGESSLVNDVLHSLEPTWPFGVILREIEVLLCSIWKLSLLHLTFPIFTQPFLGELWHVSC